MEEVTARWRCAGLDLLPAVLLFLLTVMGVVWTAGQMVSATGPVAVIGPPFSGFAGVARIVADADGSIIDMGLSSNIVIARSPGPDFADRLYQAGAWLVLDWSSLTSCLSIQGSKRP